MPKYVPKSRRPNSVPAEVIKPRRRISSIAMSRFFQQLEDRPQAPRRHSFIAPTYAPGVLPDREARLAMDDAMSALNDGEWAWASSANMQHGTWAEGIGFMGYPFLSELSQRSEYRQPCEVMAEEMTRKWIAIEATGTDDKNAKIKKLVDAIDRFGLREVFRDAIELDGIMGQSLIYPDIYMGDKPAYDDDDEIQTPLLMDKAKVARGSLAGFRVIEPTWVAPNKYDSRNPMDPTFYKPQEWFVMGKRVHISRLMQIVSRTVPDILKPAYNFGGLSLMQMMRPYIDNWLDVRQSVTDLIKAFTIWNLSTDMAATLQDGDSGVGLDDRLRLFTLMMKNRGVMATDSEAEALTNISAPLGTLDHLQAQAQEHMAAPARIPLVKLFGITPSGLNATSEGEIRTFYDSIHGMQERVLYKPLKCAIDLIQLSEFGSIDPELTSRFLPLYELDEAAQAVVRQTDANTDLIYVNGSVISPEEVRRKLANDPTSRYAGLEGPPPPPMDLLGDLDEAGNELQEPAPTGDDAALDDWQDTAREAATSAQGNSNRKTSLTPAIQAHGKIHVGDPGKSHAHIYNKVVESPHLSSQEKDKFMNAPASEHHIGFVNHRGKFMDRKQGFKYAAANHLLKPEYAHIAEHMRGNELLHYHLATDDAMLGKFKVKGKRANSSAAS